jgi:hypothetical protein
MYACVVCCKCRTVGTKKQIWMKHKVQKNIRNPGGGGGQIFRTCPDRPWGPPGLLYNGYRVSFLAVKRPGRGANHPPYLVPRLKKE